MLATLGGLGVWWLYDVITLAAGSFFDVEGRRVKYWTEDETPDREAEPLLHDVMDELHALRGEVAELTERVDFAERLLTRARQDEAPVGSKRE